MATLGAIRSGTGGGIQYIVVNAAARRHAGVKAGDVVTIVLEPDTEKRDIEIPIQLRRVLGAKLTEKLNRRKRLTNTPVRMAGSVLKCPDDRKNRVVTAQATYPCGSSAVGGRVCEQRYAQERVLPESRFELQHTGSPSKETALEEKA